MDPEPRDRQADDPLEPEQEEKDAQVLKREGIEEELMEEGDSEAGEHIADVDVDTAGGGGAE